MSSEYTWLAIDPLPSPLPTDWGNNNSYMPCFISGVLAPGKLYLQDQSKTPPVRVTWSAFTDDPRNHNYVPIYYGPTFAGQPGVEITFSISLNGTPWKWFGTETCKWFAMSGSGYWLVTGMNYETAGYPR